MERKCKMSLLRKSEGYPDIVSPSGKVHSVNNVKEFSRQHKLHFSGIATLFSSNNTLFHFKGWRLATPETVGITFLYSTYNKAHRISKGRRPSGFPTLQSPTGQLFMIKDTLKSFCEVHNLNSGNVSCLINGKKTIYRGWTIHTQQEN